MVLSFYRREKWVKVKQLKVTQLPDGNTGIQAQFQYLVFSIPGSVLLNNMSVRDADSQTVKSVCNV